LALPASIARLCATATDAGGGRTPPDPDAPSPDHAARTRSTPSE
jgi:hypothetical protein